MKQRKFISVLLALAMILGSFGFIFADEATAGADVAAPAAASDDIVILHLNDAHCHNYADYAKLLRIMASASRTEMNFLCFMLSSLRNKR